MGKCSATEKEGIDKTLKDLKLSSEELDRFDKAFKDPKFKELFEEYISEISSPQAREEQELYLRQLESEGAAESVYGKGVQLLVPEKGCTLKTKDVKTGAKVFINMCTSDKVDVAKSSKAQDSGGRKGLQWDIPLTMGHMKNGKDKKGGDCKVVDFVINPMTYKMAERNKRFKDMIVETAMERIEQQHGVRLDPKYRSPTIKYKGSDGTNKPSVMAVKTGDGGEVENGRLKPQTNKSPDEAVAVNDAKKAVCRSPFSFSKAKPKEYEEPPKDPKEFGFIHPNGETTPKYDVIHSGNLDLTEAWGDVGKNLYLNRSYPKNLAVRIRLPGLESAAQTQLDVRPNELHLSVPGKYKLDLDLKYEVDESKGRAKFDRSSKTLIIRLPTVPPPPPKLTQPDALCDPPTNSPPSTQDEPSSTSGVAHPTHEDTERAPQKAVAVTSDESSSCQNTDSGTCGNGGTTEDERNDIKENTSPEHNNAGEKSESVCAGMKRAKGMTENERKWRELHECRRAEEPQSNRVLDAVEETEGSASPIPNGPDKTGEPESITETACPQPSAQESSAQMAVDALAGAGITPPIASEVQPNQHAKGPRVAKLRPRINRNVAEELD